MSWRNVVISTPVHLSLELGNLVVGREERLVSVPLEPFENHPPDFFQSLQDIFHPATFPFDISPKFPDTFEPSAHQLLLFLFARMI